MPPCSALLLTGALAGLSIVMPVGPMGLMCIQRSLRFGFGAGFATGLGGVTMNAAYAATLLLGLRASVPMLGGGAGRVLGTLGGLFLLWSASRMLQAPAGPVLRGGAGRPSPAPSSSPSLGWRRAYLTALGYNATNPLMLILLVAALGPVVDSASLRPAGSAALLAGLVTAATGWWACVSGVASLLRTRIGGRMVLVTNRIAGLLLGAYGSAALLRAWAF